jgi:hypothetical protein
MALRVLSGALLDEFVGAEPVRDGDWKEAAGDSDCVVNVDAQT